jgi:hypothetical protein
MYYGMVECEKTRRKNREICLNLDIKMLTFWVIFLQTHPVTLDTINRIEAHSTAGKST